jgi:hypothetical protein
MSWSNVGKKRGWLEQLCTLLVVQFLWSRSTCQKRVCLLFSECNIKLKQLPVTIIASPLSILGKFCIPTGEHRGRPSGAIAPRSSVQTKITIPVTQRGRDSPLHKVAYYCVFSSVKFQNGIKPHESKRPSTFQSVWQNRLLHVKFWLNLCQNNQMFQKKNSNKIKSTSETKSTCRHSFP